MKLACLALLAIPAIAQLRGPQIGWVMQENRARPIEGIPGAAVLGSAVDLEISSLVSSDTLSLAIANEQREAVFIAPGGVERTGILAVDRVALSPRGSAGLVHAEGRARVFRDKAVVWEVDLTFLDPAPSMLTINDDGSMIAAISGDATYKITAEGIERLPIAARAIAFISSRRDLLIATENQVLLSGSEGLSVLYEGLKRAVGIASIQANRRVIVADAELRALVSIDPADGTAATIELDFEPEMLERVSSSAFRLAAAPLRIFDESRTEPFVIPPGRVVPTEPEVVQ